MTKGYEARYDADLGAYIEDAEVESVSGAQAEPDAIDVLFAQANEACGIYHVSLKGNVRRLIAQARREGEVAMRERAARLGDHKAAEHARSIFSQYSDEATKSGHNWAKSEAEYLAASIRALPLSDGTIRKD